MNTYEINFICQPLNDTTNSSKPIEYPIEIKEVFWDNNLSILTCIAMILNKDINEIKKQNPHILLYGKYLGGFKFEDFQYLPPLCILQVIADGIPYNVVYYNGEIFDPKLGVFPKIEYQNKKFQILSFIQIYLPEAYIGVDWQPVIPNEIQIELDKKPELKTGFNKLSSMEQSKILNYIYPFSKPSSIKENRVRCCPLKQKEVDSIINHIERLVKPQNAKSPWDELHEYETIEGVQTLKRCGITKDMTVLDMGCGHGHYTIPASIIVGQEGRVIAVDCQRKVIKQAQEKVTKNNLTNVTFICTNESGLNEYINKIDFIILYDVLHGAEWADNKIEKIKNLHLLLKRQGILSLALFQEIESKIPENAKPTLKGHYSTVRISHEEAIKPYIELMEMCGFKLKNVVENGGVHFDDFHSPYHWRKFGEVRVSSLERRNIYNFVK